MISPPETEEQLLSRVTSLSGRKLAGLAAEIGWPMPADLKRDKGWVGQLLEMLLGTSAGTLSEPDFQQLGIELKTLPLNADLSARETTYVCMVPLVENYGLHWRQSCVFKKLSRVLWLPIQAAPEIPLGERTIGSGFLWSPDFETMETIHADWEEFMELIALGKVETITAHQGEILQIRPKAANSSAITTGIGSHGQKTQTLPRGFYLRRNFTNSILQSHFF